jgi:excinuclease ABC subunit C
VEDAVRFLEGRRPELARSLRRQMDRAARRFDFETAARLRDRLAAIERTLQPQLVTGTTSTRDQDVFGLAQRDGRLAIYVLHVRRGRVIGGRTARFAQPSLPAEDLMASFVNLYYSQGNLVPDEVLLPVAVEGAAALAELLSERRGSPVRVVAPRRGPRRELVALSTRNAEQALARAAPEAGGSPEPDVLRSLRHRLGLRRVPHLIECFDVSHFHGEATVASKVAMVDGEPDKNLYRRYRIGTAARGDDYAAMREAVLRRLRRGPAEEGLPDLIVLDGGRAQLSAARDAADELGVRDVDFVALAKRREIGPPGPAAERRRVPERVFVPGRKDAIVLPPTASELLLLVRLRDEAHRFAHAYRQKLERRRRLRSELDRIPGIGERRRGALLRRFGSVERIRGASAEELAATEGIGAALAARIHASLQPGPGSASRAG